MGIADRYTEARESLVLPLILLLMSEWCCSRRVSRSAWAGWRPESHQGVPCGRGLSIHHTVSRHGERVFWSQQHRVPGERTGVERLQERKTLYTALLVYNQGIMVAARTWSLRYHFWVNQTVCKNYPYIQIGAVKSTKEYSTHQMWSWKQDTITSYKRPRWPDKYV
jgi:hypothetical protein